MIGRNTVLGERYKKDLEGCIQVIEEATFDKMIEKAGGDLPDDEL